MATHTCTLQCHPAIQHKGGVWFHYSPITAPRGLDEESGLKVVDGLMKLREAQVRPDMVLASPYTEQPHCIRVHVTMRIGVCIFSMLCAFECEWYVHECWCV